MNKNKGRFYFKFILVLFIILLIPLYAAFEQDVIQAVINGDISTIRSAVADNLFSSYLLTLVLMIIQNTFTIIPLILIITLNFTLFGFVNGFIWGWVSSIIAASIIFLCVKHLFQDRLQKRVNPELIKSVEEKGFSYVFKARIFPFVPTSFVNILAGLSSIQFKDFILGTALGNFFYFFILTLMPAGFFSTEINKYVWGTAIVLFILLFYIVKKKLKQRQNQKTIMVQSTQRKQSHFHDK